MGERRCTASDTGLIADSQTDRRKDKIERMQKRAKGVHWKKEEESLTLWENLALSAKKIKDQASL